MIISINTAEEITALDQKVLAILGGVSSAAPAAKKSVEEKAAPTTTKAKPKTKIEADPEPEDEDGDEVADDEGPTLDDAKARATALVSNGGAAKVKAALNVVGAKKVSEIATNKIAEFLSELDD